MSMTTTTREPSEEEEEILEGTTPTENGATTSGIHINTENGNHHDPDKDHIVADGEVSPSSLRRSTRASALKAQKNLKENMGMFPMPNGIEESTDDHLQPNNDEEEDENIEGTNNDITEPKAKKRKLINGLELDQYDCKFGVRMDDNDVYILTDESEISSLNSEEVGELRKNYEEFKQAGVSSQQKFEREIQVKELEAQLRQEENKLILLKKTVQNQKDAEADAAKKQKIIDAANARHQINMNAYKPTIATNPNAKVNGTTSKSSKGKQNNSAARDTNNHATPPIDPQLQRLLVQRLMANPNLAAQINLSPQLIQLLQQHQQHNIQKQQPSATATVAPTPAPPPAPAPAPPPAKKEPIVPTTTPAQRIAEAKRKLRQQLDQQLLSIQPPKPLISDINFIPSVTSDFCALLGLDLTVQRVLKDKNVFKKYEDENYVCEECGTNFTPAWKAIIGTENDLHLYCEKCVKDAQKKKMKHDHAALYKKALNKIGEQERELEKQIAAGKFDDPPAPPPPPPPPKAATPTAPKISTPNLASLHQSASTGSLNPVAALLLQQQQQQQRQKAQQQQHQTPQASTSNQLNSNKTKSQSKSSKRQSSSSNQASSNSTNSSSSNNNQAQMLFNLMRQNPMTAAMMMAQGNNPNLLQLMSMANGVNNSTSSGNNRSSNSNNNLGALALLQAAAAANTINNSNNNQNIFQNLLMNQNMLAQLALMQNPNGGQNFLNSLRAQQQNSQPMSKSKK
jgi:hypothetical protein